MLLFALNHLFTIKICLISLTNSQELEPSQKALKRHGSFGVLNIRKMSICKLNYNPLILINYGCYCGLGGRSRPVDKIDECCMVHDKCYDKAVQDEKCLMQHYTYIVYYEWMCRNKLLTCDSSLSGCAKEICDCDKKLVDCWSEYELPKKVEPCKY